MTDIERLLDSSRCSSTGAAEHTLVIIADLGHHYDDSTPMVKELPITPEQSRGARAMLDMKRQDLADASQVSHSALSDFEKGRRKPGHRTLAAIRSAFEATGVEFIDGDEPGMKLRKLRA